eukprot:scaffold11517_cov147-Skeletonema_menzelii.AAC.2
MWHVASCYLKWWLRWMDDGWMVSCGKWRETAYLFVPTSNELQTANCKKNVAEGCSRCHKEGTLSNNPPTRL